MPLEDGHSFTQTHQLKLELINSSPLFCFGCALCSVGRLGSRRARRRWLLPFPFRSQLCASLGPQLREVRAALDELVRLGIGLGLGVGLGSGSGLGSGLGLALALALGLGLGLGLALALALGLEEGRGEPERVAHEPGQGYG